MAIEDLQDVGEVPSKKLTHGRQHPKARRMHVQWMGALVMACCAVAEAAAPPDEPAWREPGQIVDPAYLQNGSLRYTAEGREIVGRNGTCFNNRPLYCEPTSGEVVLAGDRPFVRLTGHGAFSAAIVRDGKGRWFHEYAEVESRYRCGRMAWQISDATLPGVDVVLEVVPLNRAAGFATRLQAHGLRPGDRLVWAFGGAGPAGREHWDPIMRGNPAICKTGDPRKPQLQQGMVPQWSRHSRALIEGQVFRLLADDQAEKAAVGQCDRTGNMLAAEASACAVPAELASAVAEQQPLVCGVVELKSGEDEIFWAVEAAPVEAAWESLQTAAPAKAFAEAAAYLQAIERVEVETPESLLNAAVAAVCHPMDAACDRDPTIFRHGCMSFHIHFLGWRVICGSTALGWHDRVKGNAQFYLAHQVQEDEARIGPEPDSARLGVHESARSRFHGRGKIANSPGMYNTQTQFFDQTIRDWRWTADPELERLLRPALELQLQWARECFDPDDDGLYESYINTLPTDSVWYNGGGSVEESAYVYYGHIAARDMARRAGDEQSAAGHQARADKIQQALRRGLWLHDRGHFGLYVEQGGHQRVHADAWVYSQFLPIDAGMTTPAEALQALFYTEWALERIRLPFGGVLCQPSNWVPSKWSVRDMFGGDMWALALAYQQTGLADEGWELLLGAMLESCYAGAVPGGFSHIGAGTDFADCKDMFARAVVEGLFGYDPDYPNGVVRMRPALPSAWPQASIRTPDYTFAYRQEGETDTYRLTLSQEAEVDFRLPVRAENVRRVTLDRQPVPWQTEPGFGCTWLRLQTPRSTAAEVVIEMAGRLPQDAAVTVAGNVGDEIRLTAPRGQIVGWRDFHGVIDGAIPQGATIAGRLARRPGCHLVVAEVRVGNLPRQQVFKVRVTDTEAEAMRVARTPREAPKDARWECLDMGPQFNGDVRTIYQQHYLSPRPQTCSVRLGIDAYSAWTFPYWGNIPPVIDLSHLPELLDRSGRITTPQNVPFATVAEDKNVAFTSLWDNWPRSITMPIDKSAETAWLLICGSTNPMQLRIANAQVLFRYADGQVEKLELVPPLNFWSLSSWGGLDYDYETDAFALPALPPPTVQLGNECRAMVLSWKLRPGVTLQSITLEALSQEVVVGLMGVSLMNSEQ